MSEAIVFIKYMIWWNHLVLV